MRTNWVRAVAIAFAATTLACEGAEGPAGAAGVLGAKGDKGDPGVAGEGGLPGADGVAGVNGTPGSNGTDGKDGAPGIDGVAGKDGAPGTNGVDGKDGKDGKDGVNGAGFLSLEPAGVVGLVTAGGGLPVSSGTVYFVPAADVAALPATTVEVGSKNDEPLEDLVAEKGATYASSMVDANGTYALAQLPMGKYFVTWLPELGDSQHLPGGSLCRTALESADLVGGRFDIEVSDAAPIDAYYVGNGACVTCHGKKHIGQTMHRMGIWSPYEHGPLQDDSVHKANLYKALAEKFTVAGTKVYFYAYDSTRKFDKYKTAESDPGSGVSFTVTTRKNGADFEMVIENVANPADPSSPLVIHVDSIYGGGLWKQRYLTKVTNSYGTYLATMPLQYQHEGKEDASYGRTSKTWRDYHGDWWFNETDKKIVAAPATKNSFEKNCASCHAQTAQLTGSDTTAWKISPIADPVWGDFDYDGDGVRDEMNVGCETCHGPGSAHWEATGQGKHIVRPQLLTPERESMICGQCHSRPKGAFGSDSPVNAQGWMMTAGTSRDTFLASYAVSQMDGAASDYWADEHKSSKSHHQQYTDFIRSKLYKNDNQLITCSDCHNPHKWSNTRQLRADPTDNKASCGTCHEDKAANLATHIDAKLGAGMGSMMASSNCIDCHMVKTAKTGAGRPGLKIGTVQFWDNDVTSHLFKVNDKSESKADGTGVPTAYTNKCGSCHTNVP